MTARDFRNVILFMCNQWSKGRCNVIFNGPDFDIENWQYSIGEHIWNKWNYGCEYHNGSLDCIAWFITELDNNTLQKLIDYVEEFYKK